MWHCATGAASCSRLQGRLELAAMAFLSANNRPESGKKYDLKGLQCVMGRHPDCEIVVDVGAVSRQHAKLFLDANDYYAQDLNSRNHTFLNDVDIFGLGP